MGETDAKPKCPDCGYEIDPDWCWCGEDEKSHQGVRQNHPFVPMGCHCLFSDHRVEEKVNE